MVRPGNVGKVRGLRSEPSRVGNSDYGSRENCPMERLRRAERSETVGGATRRQRSAAGHATLRWSDGVLGEGPVCDAGAGCLMLPIHFRSRGATRMRIPLIALVVCVLVVQGSMAASNVTKGTSSAYLPRVGTGHTSNASVSPGARTGAAIAWDPVGSRWLLFGGENDGGCGGTSNIVCNDTWAFTPSNLMNTAGNWSRLNLTVSPPPRTGASMVYITTHAPHSHNRSQADLLFGGFNPKTGQEFGDTWLFTNGTWKNITSSAGQPPARHDAAMAVASKLWTSHVLLFGGLRNCRTGLCSLGDTWMLSYVGGRTLRWVQIGSCGGPHQLGCGSFAPAPRWGAAVFSRVHSNLFALFGGARTSNLRSAQADTWFFQWGNWSNVTASYSSNHPSPRVLASGGAQSAYLKPHILFGGEGVNGTALNDTWNFTFWPRAWHQISAAFGVAPPARFGAAFGSGFYPSNPSANRTGLLLFGGSSCTPATLKCLRGDSWVFVARGSTTPAYWTQV